MVLLLPLGCPGTATYQAGMDEAGLSPLSASSLGMSKAPKHTSQERMKGSLEHVGQRVRSPAVNASREVVCSEDFSVAALLENSFLRQQSTKQLVLFIRG